MKAGNFFNFLALVLFVGFAASCSKSSDDDGGDNNNNNNNNNNNVVTSISVEADKSEFLEGGMVTFFVKDNLNYNVTSSSTIYVNGAAISGSSYTFTAAGEYQVHATRENLQSSAITVKSIAATHTTKVMIEDYTGTWCGYCPRLATALEVAVNQNSNIIPVAIHDDNEMLFQYANVLESEFNITGFPSGRVNRTISWNESVSQPVGLLGDKKNLGLAINSSISGNMINATVKVHYDLRASEQNRLVVYLLENGLIYDQVNYYNGDPNSPWYQDGNPIVGFVHDHVARTVFTNVFGDDIPSSQAITGNTYTQNYSLAIPTSVQNNANLEIVAFVVGEDNTVINVQKADVGEDKDFD